MAERMLRPLGLGDIFDEAFDLYKDNLLFFVLVGAVTAVPLQVVQGILSVHFARDMHSITGFFGGGIPDITQIFSLLGVMASGLAVLIPVCVAGFAVQSVALAAATSARYLGEGATVGSVYRRTLRRIGPLILTALLWSAFMGLGFALCYAGAIIPLTLLAFTAHAFAVEGRDGWRFWQALSRSRALVNGLGGRVFGALCLLGLVYLILSVGIEMPLDYALGALLALVPGAGALVTPTASADAFNVRSAIINQVSSGMADIIIAPFLMCVVTVLYFDLRVRKEAFDVERLAQGLQYAVLPWEQIYKSPPRPPRRVRKMGKTIT